MLFHCNSLIRPGANTVEISRRVEKDRKSGQRSSTLTHQVRTMSAYLDFIAFLR